MKVITTYQCEICRQEYSTEKQALQCEQRGWFNSDKYPKGLMFQYYINDYIGIFAIPNDIKPTNGGYNRGHIGESSYWACRDKTKYNGDLLGEEMCGYDYFKSDEESFAHWIKYHHISEDKVGCEEYNRMVDFLKSKGIQPSYYNQNGEFIIVK